MRLWADPQRAFTLLITHTGAHKHAKYEKLKDYNVKDYYCVGYINLKMPTCHDGLWLRASKLGYLAHEQIRFLSGDAFSLCACKFRSVNNKSAMARAQLALKGMRDETLIGLLYVIPKKHPLLIKRIGTTRLDQAPGRTDRFPIVKLAKVDSDC